MDFQDLCAARRSIRRFSPESPTEEEVRALLRAALLGPSSKNRRDWNFIVTRDREIIDALSGAKEGGAAFLEGAPCVIAVVGTPSRNDCWVEDCSVAAASILYQAQDLGLGACWVQFRGRGKVDPQTGGTILCDDFLRKLFSLDEEQRVLCAVAVGYPLTPKPPKQLEDEDWEKVRYL